MKILKDYLRKEINNYMSSYIHLYSFLLIQLY